MVGAEDNWKGSNDLLETIEKLFSKLQVLTLVRGTRGFFYLTWTQKPNEKGLCKSQDLPLSIYKGAPGCALWPSPVRTRRKGVRYTCTL